MHNPLDDLPSLALDTFAELDIAGMEQPFDWTPDFEESENPEIAPTIGVDRDLRHVRTPNRRLFVDYRSNPEAYRHLSPLPAVGESLHGVIGGRYALFDLLPAILETTGRTIDELYLTTLSFSLKNGTDLLGLLDDGHVKRLTFVVSHYFKGTNTGIYDAIVPELLARGQRVVAMRNHSKVILAKLDDGRHFSINSSANMRSCDNVETFVFDHDRATYQFHAAWIDDVYERANRKRQAGIDTGRVEEKA